MGTANETGSWERLLEASRAACAAFSRNREDGTEMALKAVIASCRQISPRRWKSASMTSA